MKRALNDPTLFALAYLDHGILTWPHGYDIAPETLRRYAEAGSLDLGKDYKPRKGFTTFTPP